MLRFKARKGAIVVMVGLMFFGLLAISALAIDFSRLWSLRNELETSADASALAGAIQLLPSHLKRDASDTARAYALTNLAMQGTVTVQSIVLGKWDPTTEVFTAGAVDSNAISVTVSRPARGLVMSGLGVPVPTLQARAIAWAEAPVATTSCIKPWALPYVLLMSRLNTYRGLANTTANLTRPFDQVLDIAALNSMDSASRSFSLKLGSGAITDPIADSLNIPGNYQGVQLPKYTLDPSAPSPQPGANAYQDVESGKICYGLGVGDSLITQGGVMAGPTIAGADKSNPQTAPYGICDNIVNNRKSSTNGDCTNSAVPGGVGVDVPAAFYMCASGCSGQSMVTVQLLGSFTLFKVFPNSDIGNTPQWDMAEIRGMFKPMQASGPVGGGSTTLQRPILVR